MSTLTECVVPSKDVTAVTRDRKWIPLIWLPYFFFFVLAPVLEHASAKIWALDALGGAVFLVLFFGMFWLRKPWSWYCLAGIAILGLLFAPINGGAATFFIYAAGFAPFLTDTEIDAVKVIAVVVAAACLETWLLHLSWWFLLYAGGFAAVLGTGNIFFAQRNRANLKLRMAKEEIEHLAKVAERERIARDLHDVLGHTLTAIVVKSELAEKLMDRYPERAKQDIQDIQKTAREALAEVRNTIRGYRADTLDAEFKQATDILKTAGLSVKSETADVSLSPAQESIVALIVREAVTNVVRHAHARTCQLRMAPMNGSCVLEIQDDGRGGLSIEGNGLRGMRERVEALGGTLVRQTEAGTKLTIQFPLAQAKSNGSH
jgi:two-component system, NarL family, sensor histidine kinase DesK